MCKPGRSRRPAPLVEVGPSDKVEARLGVEPKLAQTLAAGQVVRLRAINDPSGDGVEGHVRLVSRRMNPDSRMIDVFLSLPPGSGLILDQAISGEIMRQANDALLVPRDAAVPTDEGGYAVYVVQDGHAVRRSVKVGLENNTEMQVEGEGLKEGAKVVVVGNYELTDGIAVQSDGTPETQPTATTQASTTLPATTERATTERATTERATTEPATT